LTGTYMAWLSDSASTPLSRFTNTANTGPYQLVNGTPIAANWATLIDGGIDNPINLTESGGAPPVNLVWTKTLANGTFDPDDTTCTEWSVADSNASAGGDTTRSDLGWTDSFGGLLCTQSIPLYCFEQG
jgi:hypothetical protein